jgi:phosphopantetheinyl transferase
MRTILNPEETARADRFFMDVHRNRFIAGRALLRDLLAGYLGQPPEAIRFVYNEWGKPALAPGFAARDLRFNLSHSQDLAMYAFVLERDVGVDLEMIRAEVANERVAENFFSPSEVATLRALPLEHQAEGFFNCWTRKEAYVKVRGQGLSIELKSFDISLIPGQRRRFSWRRLPRLVAGFIQARSGLCGCHGNPGKSASNRRELTLSERIHSLFFPGRSAVRTQSPELVGASVDLVRAPASDLDGMK